MSFFLYRISDELVALDDGHTMDIRKQADRLLDLLLRRLLVSIRTFRGQETVLQFLRRDVFVLGVSDRDELGLLGNIFIRISALLCLYECDALVLPTISMDV